MGQNGRVGGHVGSLKGVWGRQLVCDMSAWPWRGKHSQNGARTRPGSERGWETQPALRSAARAPVDTLHECGQCSPESYGLDRQMSRLSWWSRLIGCFPSGCTPGTLTLPCPLLPFAHRSMCCWTRPPPAGTPWSARVSPSATPPASSWSARVSAAAAAAADGDLCDHGAPHFWTKRCTIAVLVPDLGRLWSEALTSTVQHGRITILCPPTRHPARQPRGG